MSNLRVGQASRLSYRSVRALTGTGEFSHALTMSSVAGTEAAPGGNVPDAATPASHGKRAVLAISLVVGFAIAVVLFVCDPSRVPIYPVCTFHRLTGLDCPGCGTLRAAHQLLHGNLSAALHFNALFVLSLPLLAWVGFRLVRRTRSDRPATPAVRSKWIWWYVAAWIAFGVLRDLPLPFFASFAP